MSDALNIRRLQRRDERGSKYQLRREPVKLKARMVVGVRPDGDGWEPVWLETTTEEVHRTRSKIKESRKQKAARAAIKKETRAEVKKVAMSRRLTEMRLLGMDTRKEELVQQIKDLWKVADPQRKQRPDEYLEEERKALAERFSDRRNK